jgi:hypothetical protein
MYLDGKLLDAVPSCSITLRNRHRQHVADLKATLLKKNKALLLEKETPPTFILSGIQSRMNLFVPLPTFRH